MHVYEGTDAALIVGRVAMSRGVPVELSEEEAALVSRRADVREVKRIPMPLSPKTKASKEPKKSAEPKEEG